MICPVRASIAALLMTAGVPAGALRAQSADGASFVVLRGADTVAVETFSRSAGRLEGTLTLRAGPATVERYTAIVAPDETLPLIEVTVREPSVNDSLRPRTIQRARVIFKADSAAIDAVTNGGLVTRVYGTKTGAVPYLNLSFALMEQAVRRAAAVGGGAPEVSFFNLGGGQTLTAVVRRTDGETVRVGLGEVEFVLRVDSAGNILSGTIPSQDVRVDRVRGT